MRIGTKNFGVSIDLRKKPTYWHIGKYTVIIFAYGKYGAAKWWTFIPSGKPHMGWIRFIRREWRNLRLLFR